MSDRNRIWRPSGGRRRFLALLSGTAAAALVAPLLPQRRGSTERDLREADFYRPHDLAG